MKVYEQSDKCFAAKNSITWKFDSLSAPYMDARLVRSVKQPLTTIIKDHILSNFHLITLPTDVEE